MKRLLKKSERILLLNGKSRANLNRKDAVSAFLKDPDYAIKLVVG